MKSDGGNMLRISRIVAATAAVAVLLAVTNTAEAAPIAVCDPGELCVYQHPDYKGAWIQYRPPTYSDCFSPSVYGLNNAISSVRNRTSVHVALMDSGECRGSAVIVLAGQSLPNLGTCCAYDNRVSGITRW